MVMICDLHKKVCKNLALLSSKIYTKTQRLQQVFASGYLALLSSKIYSKTQRLQQVFASGYLALLSSKIYTKTQRCSPQDIFDIEYPLTYYF